MRGCNSCMAFIDLTCLTVSGYKATFIATVNKIMAIP